jgi:beta-glucanase (GH16 family)
VTGAEPSATAPCNPDEPAGYATSAAAKFGWGKPNRVDDFSGGLDKSWGVYNGPGHGGKGRRTPDAVSVENGVLTITGDPQGNTAGMAWGDGQKYGRWEGRVKAPVGDRSYNALLLLWPDAENWPVGGEVDFMEMSDHTRQTTDMFLHYGSSNSQLHGEVTIDATEWHNWAVEWTPDHITAFVDGKQWFHTEKKEALPPGPMHLCIQLDWFPKSGAAVQTSHMYVDWVRQYSLDRLRNTGGVLTVSGADLVWTGAAEIPGGVVRCAGGRVVDGDVPGEVLDASGCVVTPGLVNAHHHLLQTAFRTLPGTRGVPMREWLPRMAAAYAAVGVDAELARAAAQPAWPRRSSAA